MDTTGAFYVFSLGIQAEHFLTDSFQLNCNLNSIQFFLYVLFFKIFLLKFVDFCSLYLQTKLERHLIDSHKVKNDAVLKTLVVTKPISSDKQQQQLITKSISLPNHQSTNSTNHHQQFTKELNSNELIASTGNEQSRIMKHQEATSTHHEQGKIIKIAINARHKLTKNK